MTQGLAFKTSKNWNWNINHNMQL